jgi:hypothetical protein
MPPGLEDPARIGKAILVSRKPPAWRRVDEACDWAGLVDGDDNQGEAWWRPRSAMPKTTLKGGGRCRIRAPRRLFRSLLGKASSTSHRV